MPEDLESGDLAADIERFVADLETGAPAEQYARIFGHHLRKGHFTYGDDPAPTPPMVCESLEEEPLC
jgi:hypothetical protein